MVLKKQNIIGLGIGFFLAVVASAFFWGTKYFLFIMVISFIAGVIPFVISANLMSSNHRKKEEKFLEFVRDLVENVKSGTPISKAIINLSKRDYGPLTSHTQKLANQISLGIPVQKSLITFSKDIKSSLISRSVSLISEAEKAGGKIEEILESVSNSVEQTDKLKKEQKSEVYSLVVQGYIIFIVFIAIMLVLQFLLLPMMANVVETDMDLSSSTTPKISIEDLSSPLLFLLVVQAFFAGLVIGKIAEGDLMAGIKHSFTLVTLALLVMSIARVFFS